jgi:dihydrolipoamide dehydrogenase
MTATNSFDILVIGGGPAGYVAAIQAAMLGGRVGLVERGALGGTCLNRGCIPTKSYLKNAEILHEIKNASKRGIEIALDSLNVNMKKTRSNKDRVVRKLSAGVGLLLKSHGVEAFKVDAVITDSSFAVELSTGETLSASKIILAGGSEPAMPSFLAGIESERILDSTSILQLTELPPRLGILGGGVIGVEMARAFSAFGSEVTLVEALDRVAPFLDEELSAELDTDLQTTCGVTVHTSTKLLAAEETDSGLTLSLEGQDPVEVDALLVSVGRKPDLTAIANLDVKTDAGKVIVDDRMETSIPGLYAPGDINGQCMLAHAAFKMGETAAKNAMGHDDKYDGRFVPSCIYGHPEVGSVGLTEAAAREKCADLAVGKFPFSANGRALASGMPEGFVKILVDPQYGEILGCHIVGAGASELINEPAALMAQEITAHELADQVHAHPSCSEAIMEAAAAALGRCLHLPKTE